MRFSSLALSAAAVLTASTLQSYNGFADAIDITEPLDNSEKFEFQAEVNRMLDIVVNSLYQNKDVFLRELISNASDALDKARFLGISKPEILADKSELEVRISYDSEEKTLTITDSGIGMTKEELVKFLGTVASSGTTKFMEALQEGASDISQIGMFGVGFYSSFLVSDKVTVASKHPHDPVQHIWESSNGDSSFYIAEDPRGNTLVRGTEITLHLKDDAEEYLSTQKLETLVSHYSEFVTHPIFLRKTETMMVPDEEDLGDEEQGDDGEDELDVSEEDSDAEDPKMKEVVTHSWERANADTALWTRPKDDISDDDYQAFFKNINGEYGGNATSWSHFDAEGNINFKALVYMPEVIPQNLRDGNFEAKNKLKLYVRKVLISDEFELLPRYMSFVKGVIDSDDLPLNVNRETLQESKIIAIIRKKVTRKVIEMLKKLSDREISEDEDDNEEDVEIDEDGNVIEVEKPPKTPKEHPYIEWYKKFSPSIKMGVMEDEPNRNKLAKLLRVKTSKSNDEYISFEQYVENMKEWQKEIYYIAGTDEKELAKSPFMEKFNEKDLEVVFFTEPADEYMIGHLTEFDGKKFKGITKETVNFDDEDKDLNKRIFEAYMDKFRPLIKFMQKFYGRSIMRVQVSKRLGNTPAIISTSEFGHTANMERLMMAQAFQHGQNVDTMRGMRTLEINPRHPFITKILEQIPEDDDESNNIDQNLKDSLWNLLDTALLSGGFPIDDSQAYSKRMIRTLKRSLDVESLELEPEIEPKVEEDVPSDIDLDEHDGINVEDWDGEDI